MAKRRIRISGADHLLRGQLQHKLTISGKEISAKQLYVRFVSLFEGANPATFNLDDKVGDWISPWPGFAPAFINKANKFPPFKHDGMRLTLRNISAATSIGDVGEAIVDWYKADGWTII